LIKIDKNQRQTTDDLIAKKPTLYVPRDKETSAQSIAELVTVLLIKRRSQRDISMGGCGYKAARRHGYHGHINTQRTLS
jgi:hypothetical protein